MCLATLGGEVVLESKRGKRRLSADSFQTGMLATAKAPDEILVEARFPVAASGFGFAFEEITRRRGDFAIVALAAVASNSTIRLGVGGVADKPAVREWKDLDGDSLDDALNAFTIGGGYVYLNRGVLAEAGDACELAGVLAHEIAHVRERHIARRSEGQGLVMLASLVARHLLLFVR